MDFNDMFEIGTTGKRFVFTMVYIQNMFSKDAADLALLTSM